MVLITSKYLPKVARYNLVFLKSISVSLCTLVKDDLLIAYILTVLCVLLLSLSTLVLSLIVMYIHSKPLARETPFDYMSLQTAYIIEMSVWRICGTYLVAFWFGPFNPFLCNIISKISYFCYCLMLVSPFITVIYR